MDYAAYLVERNAGGYRRGGGNYHTRAGLSPVNFGRCEVKGTYYVVMAEAVDEAGTDAAVLLGVIRYYASMKDGVCKAERETMAARVGCSLRTLDAAIDKLQAAGYIADLTPGLRHHPHRYQLTPLALELYGKEENPERGKPERTKPERVKQAQIELETPEERAAFYIVSSFTSAKDAERKITDARQAGTDVLKDAIQYAEWGFANGRERAAKVIAAWQACLLDFGRRDDCELYAGYLLATAAGVSDFRFSDMTPEEAQAAITKHLERIEGRRAAIAESLSAKVEETEEIETLY